MGKIEKVKTEVVGVEFNAQQRKEYERRCKQIQEDFLQIKVTLVNVGISLYEIERTKSFQIDGYETIQEMASEKFNIGKTYCNQCINICKKFGRFDEKTGECLGLKEEYEVYNTSQLCELISMNTELREKVTPNMTIAEIRHLKKSAKNNTTAKKKKEKASKSDKKQIGKSKKVSICKAAYSDDFLEMNGAEILESAKEFIETHPTTDVEIVVSLVYTE